MVQKKQKDDLAKAKRVIEAAQKRHRRTRQKFYEEVAKTARHWLRTGVLGQITVYSDDGPARLIKQK
ncbi:hypothetical protein BX600DRAFT_447308 [Xylariales sp. PMI_506]|nr:hypothetical protein BX600DRAFT_447308 [Xylariales sp. PMI_506]